jgi:hypothetical protein
MFQILPLLFGGSFVATALGLTWHDSLSKDQKKLVDRRAKELAMTLFKKSLEYLTQNQMTLVYDQVKKNLGY